MVLIFDSPSARNHDVANSRVAAGEQQMIQGCIRRRPHHGRMRGIEHQPVGTTAHFDGPGRLADGLRAIAGGVAPKAGTHVRFVAGGKDGAPLLAQTLLIFQPAQLLGWTHGGLTVGAHAEASARFHEACRIEKAVTEVGFSTDGDAYAGLSVGDALEFLRRGVSGMD